MMWKKNCPKCGCEQVYSCKSILTSSIKKNTRCNKCRGIENRKFKSEKLERICSCGNSMIYKSYLIYKRAVKGNWQCKKCATKQSAKMVDRSYQRKNDYIKRMSKKLKMAWRQSKNYNSELHKERLREAKLNQIKRLGTINNYNPKACLFIDDLNEKFGWNLQHALNGGEIVISGYSLDGYDSERNIVFEYDESRHNSPSKKPFDLIRQKRIIDKIHPSMFIRYNERFNVLNDIIINKEIL